MKTLALGLALAVLATGAFAADKPLAPDNTLSAAEKAAGWTLLFDGKTTAGWRGFKTPAPDAGWTVRDGALSPDAKTSKDLVTKANYENFELDFDWKISPKGNSGVMFHVIEVGDETYESGPEPVGEFNHGHILVDHNKVQHWLNGTKVAEYEIGSPDFKARVAASKFKRWPQFATGKAGAIVLQCHESDVAFKNIKIKVLK